MKIAAITITYNRLDLTKRTLESFNAKTGVDYHLFIDNASRDGTQAFIEQFDHILLDQNYGIAYAFTAAYNAIEESVGKFDYYLKLDNDIETVTDDLVAKMLRFHEIAGENFVCSPVDMMIDPAYYPVIMQRKKYGDYNCEHTSHTGGAFQLIPAKICKLLCEDFRHFQAGDSTIGHFYRTKGYLPTYLKDLEMKHIGLNRSTPHNEYRM